MYLAPRLEEGGSTFLVQINLPKYIPALPAKMLTPGYAFNTILTSASVLKSYFNISETQLEGYLDTPAQSPIVLAQRKMMGRLKILTFKSMTQPNCSQSRPNEDTHRNKL